MTKPTDMGMNKTGMAMSPIAGKLMMENVEIGTADPIRGMAGIVALRRQFAKGVPLGTVPPPGSLKGVAATAVDMLKGKRPNVLIDRLAARLAFERTGSRLYDAILPKLESAEEPEVKRSLESIRRFRADELRHFQTVWEAIESLGADPTAVTPTADVSSLEGMGLLAVALDPRTNAAESLTALLTAELVDNEAWTQLVRLTERLGHDEIAHGFRVALHEEEQHLSEVRFLLTALMLRDAVRA